MTYRAFLDAEDEAIKEEERLLADDIEPNTEFSPKDLWKFGHVYIGSRLTSTFAAVEKLHSNDEAFHDLRAKFKQCISTLSQHDLYLGPDTKVCRIHFPSVLL